MNRYRTVLWSLVASVFLGVPTLAGGQVAGDPASPSAQSTPDTRLTLERVLVRVNGDVFSQGELTSRQIEALQEMKIQGNAQIETSLAEVTPTLLVAAVDELLLVQRAKELGYQYTEDLFQQMVDNIKKDNNNLNDEQFERALGEAGLTMTVLRQRLERSYLVRLVQEREVGRTLSITTEEMRQFYERNPDVFLTPATVTLRELMVVVPTRTEGGKDVFSVADEAQAKAKIEGLRERVLAGESFNALVSEFSESPTKSAGGVIGPINMEDLNPTIRDAIEGLPVGGVTAALRGPRSFQIFYLDNRTVPSARPFESVRNEIEMMLREERIEPETEKLLSRLRTQAVIEWKDDTYKRLYEQQLAKAPQP